MFTAGALTRNKSGADPDAPSFLEGRIDETLYMQLRAHQIDLLRGLPYDLPYNPRAAAIRTMQGQEVALLQPMISSVSWTPIGPAPLPNGQTTGRSDPVSGRVTAIAIHPTNPDVTYVGTAQGGLYRTLDGGATWTPLMDNALSLAIGALAIAPSNPTTVFVGTGEANFSLDSYFGVGVYRITNADTTPTLDGPFNLDGSSVDVFTGRAISKILVDPNDANRIFVATATGVGGIGGDLPASLPSRGLYRSTNALDPSSPTFTKLTVATANGGNRSITDLVFEPGNPNILLAAVRGFNGAGDGGIYRSVDALAATPTFTRTQTVGTAVSIYNTKLAINTVGLTVTVLAATEESGGALRESTDGGVTWPTVLSGANGFCSGQCFYDMAVAVDPANANVIYLGGSANGASTRILVKTINGAGFTSIDTGLHADTHALAIAPSDANTVYVGNDGGIWKSTDAGANWTSLNNATFSATQFQSLALHPVDRNFMIGGTQDNGTEYMRSDATWTRADFGDGGFALIDQGATDTTTVTLYHTYFNQTNNLIGLARVTNTACAADNEWVYRGAGFVDATTGCEGVALGANNGINLSDSVLFYAPIALGPGTPNTLYFGTDRLYRSTNKGDTMTVVSQGPFAIGVPVSAIGISSQNDNVRIVGLANGQVFATTTGANPLTDITGPFPFAYVARAVIDPHDSNTAYVTLSGFGLAAGQHIWKTTNLGAGTPTWMASGNGIPDVPVNAFVIDPSDSNILYAGTDIGVYQSSNGGASWTPFSSGLPRVAVFDAAIQGPNRVLRIATHGRGIWEIQLAGLSTIYLPLILK